MNSEIRYRILKAVEEEPQITQRELASKLGVSVGKVNYCLRALMKKGFVKAKNFKNSSRKRQYMYKLTPQGVSERTRVTIAFLRVKSAEFDEIRAEIDRLEAQLTAEEANA
ncbi:MAG TPA: MarR family EPS-associated transcriptional regulator [Rhodothermales bacterium]|nr:MarR family EPS-associated transcriptional regulator [Rhodothermales bacterium]